MKELWLILVSLLSLLPLSAQTYYLPKTAVRFHLLIEKQTYTPGDFAHYAERYLRLGHIQEQEQVSHRVISCDLTSLGMRDTCKCYTLRLKGKGETADIRLSDDGILLAINAEPIPLSVHQAQTTHHTQATTPSPRSLLSAEVVMAGSTAKMAELTAQQIFELREHRQQLATGEADDMPQDEQQLQLMLRRIDQQHDALMSLFTGTIHRDTTTAIVTLCPEQPTKREVVFRLSHRRGLVDKDDLSGIPFYMTLQNLYPTEQTDVGNKKDEGIYTNVPGMARLTLQQEDLPLATFDIPLAQFGHVELRDGSAFKRNQCHLQLHPATGAVVSFHLTE